MALALAVLIWLLTFGITLLFILARTHWWFPELISEYGQIDSQFVATLLVTGVAFIVSHIALGYCIYRYRSDKKGEALYSHGNTRLEIVWTIVIAATFIVTAFFGQRVWFQLHLTTPPPDAQKVEVTGQQFAWVFRYPGPDGKFGRIDPTKIDDQDNPLGIDPTDPDGKDDVVSRGKLTVPLNRPVHAILRSKDVTHSFFIPYLRIKQDTVPGMNISIHFTATKLGIYEIACAELCGLGHYKMRGTFEVKDGAEFDQWLKSQSPQQ